MWGQERPLLVREVFVPLIRAPPDAAPERCHTRSATSWPALINALLLIQHGETDGRVSVKQVRRMAQAMKAAGKTVELITYPGADHAPPGQFRGYPEVLRWFQRYVDNPGEDHAFIPHQRAIAAVETWFRTSYRRP